jgi:hypothetical protein
VEGNCDTSQYSPRLNPIGSAFHPWNTARKAAERAANGLQRRVGSFTRGLKPSSECVGYFGQGWL